MGETGQDCQKRPGPRAEGDFRCLRKSKSRSGRQADLKCANSLQFFTERVPAEPL
jgi:hypothetical protein